MAKSHSKILLARFSALGDVAMTLPEVYDACTASPDKHFYYLTRKHPAQVFVNPPENLTVIGIDTDDYHGVAGMFRLAAELRRKYDIDLFIDLHSVLRTRLLGLAMRLAGVRVVSLHKGRAAKRALIRRRNKVVMQVKPMIQRYRDTFYRAGIPLDSSFRSLFGAEPADNAIFADVTGPKLSGEKWLAVAPFAKHAGKIYPTDLLKKVTDHFADLPGWKLFIFGFGDKEAEIIDTLSDGRRNVVNMARVRAGIPTELALLSHCDVMLSMDSANMHLASLVGLRTVSVWGATHPYAGFMGWHQQQRDAVQLDMVCRPCSVFGNKPCFRNDCHCMRGIPPSLIISRIEAGIIPRVHRQTPSDKP